ncbi:unnamed protein product [Spirodela intermedia]|uniref:Uncharacterized protein n=1 Tax=Spirodela intermedia TaxID=51605 RepID=A0A7I8IAV8_SPIIN|nr:unnamed protein product [Spirodela intermedia]CAA6654172.1 unnamed protein product [Spirodela intermedia]
MTVVGEDDGARADEGAYRRRKDHEEDLLFGLEGRVVAGDGVGVEEADDGEDQDGEGGVDEVSKAEPVIGEVCSGGFRIPEGPESLARHDAVVDLAVCISIAVGEAGEGAGEAADAEEDAAEDLVDNAAVTVVRQHPIEELEEEDGSGGEEPDEVAQPLEGLTPRPLNKNKNLASLCQINWESGLKNSMRGHKHFLSTIF